MTVYRRMTWGLSLLTVVTLGFAFAAISIVLDRYKLRQLDDSLLEVAHTEAAEAPDNKFSFTTRPGPATNDVGPLERYGIMFDEEGRILAATAPFDAALSLLPDLGSSIDLPFDFSFASRRYRGVMVRIPGYAGRRLLLAASREDLDGDSRFVRDAMLIALAVSVAWLLGAIRWLVRRSMRDQGRVAELLHRVASGDVNAKVLDQVSDSELRRMAGDIEQIAQRLAALIEQQRRFIAHAAHELRSPLTALHGEIQQALRKERSNDEYRASLAFLLRASARLKHLADELLEFAHAERKAKPSEPLSVDLALSEVIESLGPLAKEKDVRIDRDPTTSAVLAAQEDLERILQNLLDNAIRHSPKGGAVRLELDDGERVLIRVRDQGPGVRVEDRDAIFEPFHRSPESRAKARGAGLGLAIARELARKHGGDVTLGDETNCFIVSLPRATPSSGNPRSVPPAESPSPDGHPS
jgi:two-component system heavy metal sensor histidine kinase CusS